VVNAPAWLGPEPETASPPDGNGQRGSDERAGAQLPEPREDEVPAEAQGAEAPVAEHEDEVPADRSVPPSAGYRPQPQYESYLPPEMYDAEDGGDYYYGDEDEDQFARVALWVSQWNETSPT
jgi:hypothetical protein